MFIGFSFCRRCSAAANNPNQKRTILLLFEMNDQEHPLSTGVANTRLNMESKVKKRL